MAETENSTPAVDDIPVDAGPSEQDLLDAVLANSQFTANESDNVPLPEEEEIVEDPDESTVEEEDPEVDDSETDVEEEVEEEVEETEGEDDASTQEPEVYTAEDLDLDAKVVVKVDGEEQEVSFGDLLKGYQTDTHLSKKGRELGEAQKALDEERTEKLGQVEELLSANAAMMRSRENLFSKQYHDIEAKIKKARADGDKYELDELKDQREQAQQHYWQARKQREQLIQNVAAQRQEVQQVQYKEQMEHFQSEIPNLIPDFDEKVAQDIRQFALDRGINEALIDSVMDPTIVKFIDDFRRREQQVTKGQAKRKVAPAKKALPAKKAPSKSKKKADAEKMRKARAFREDASSEDQMSFLRDYASKSLSNL